MSQETVTTPIPEALKNFDQLPNSASVRQPVVQALYACSPASVWRGVNAGRIPKPRNYHRVLRVGTWVNYVKRYQLAEMGRGKNDKKIPPQKKAVFHEINRHFTGDSAKEQCARLLQALKRFSINTFEASRGLGIYHPPARILQLRQQGHKINTIWQTIVAENGDKHRVGCYVLGSGGRHE